MVIAHVAGVPVEEMLPTLASAGTGLLAEGAGCGCGGGCRRRARHMTDPPHRAHLPGACGGRVRCGPTRRSSAGGTRATMGDDRGRSRPARRRCRSRHHAHLSKDAEHGGGAPARDRPAEPPCVHGPGTDTRRMLIEIDFRETRCHHRQLHLAESGTKRLHAITRTGGKVANLARSGAPRPAG
jgi:hypothetical protein